MKAVKNSLIFILLILCNSTYSQQLRIGIFRDVATKQVIFDYAKGSYSIYVDTGYYASILPSESVQLQVSANNQIELKHNYQVVGKYKSIKLIENQPNSNLSIQVTQPKTKVRKYQNDFEIFAKDGVLTIVNLVDIDNYLAGVVESEGGGGKQLEYYKVQALISRSYLFKYFSKHEKEGFSVCDRVHCQAYHSMMRFTPTIDSAVKATKNLVMEDENNTLIDAFFHANCGGQTSEAKYVWNNNIAYLNSFKDTFCIYTKQAVWDKRISQQEWADFLVQQYNYPINDSVYGPLIFTFNQPDRMAFYHSSLLGIPLRDIRDRFKLRSTFFNVYPDGTDVILTGRGYGHGVGLCQEGAMKMALFGYSFRQIALYYFPGAHIVDRQRDEFFKYVTDW
ncbi:MAG TPA: SpoIID/LytB domain-containing protein [Crocinitomicaceae bacterium]|nr:SpoIID/LytB domain-containing protein [Crocinitomicaceae bacterium]